MSAGSRVAVYATPDRYGHRATVVSEDGNKITVRFSDGVERVVVRYDLEVLEEEGES